MVAVVLELINIVADAPRCKCRTALMFALIASVWRKELQSLNSSRIAKVIW